MKYLHEFLEAAAAASPEHVAIECGETRLIDCVQASTRNIDALLVFPRVASQGDEGMATGFGRREFFELGNDCGC